MKMGAGTKGVPFSKWRMLCKFQNNWLTNEKFREFNYLFNNKCHFFIIIKNAWPIELEKGCPYKPERKVSVMKDFHTHTFFAIFLANELVSRPIIVFHFDIPIVKSHLKDFLQVFFCNQMQ